MSRNYITEENRIYLPDESGDILAEIDFEKVDEKTYNISHTFVDDSMR
jgi:predicted GNAT family acetyltransferase